MDHISIRTSRPRSPRYGTSCTAVSELCLFCLDLGEKLDPEPSLGARPKQKRWTIPVKCHGGLGAHKSGDVTDPVRPSEACVSTGCACPAARLLERHHLCNRLLCSIVQVIRRDQLDTALPEQRLALLHVGALQTHHQRHRQLDILGGGDDACKK